MATTIATDCAGEPALARVGALVIGETPGQSGHAATSSFSSLHAISISISSSPFIPHSHHPIFIITPHPLFRNARKGTWFGREVASGVFGISDCSASFAPHPGFHFDLSLALGRGGIAGRRGVALLLTCTLGHTLVFSGGPAPFPVRRPLRGMEDPRLASDSRGYPPASCSCQKPSFFHPLIIIPSSFIGVLVAKRT